MSRRSQALRFSNKITVPAQRTAPDAVKVIQPGARCCRCCEGVQGGCATPDAHTTECSLMTHRVTTGWTA